MSIYLKINKDKLKDKQKIIDGLFNLNSSQCFCNSANRNHQEQKLAENVKGLPTSTTDIIKANISTNNLFVCEIYLYY